MLQRSLQKDFGERQLFDLEDESCLWVPSRRQRIQHSLESAFKGLRGFQATELGKQWLAMLLCHPSIRAIIGRGAYILMH